METTFLFDEIILLYKWTLYFARTKNLRFQYLIIQLSKLSELRLRYLVLHSRYIFRSGTKEIIPFIGVEQKKKNYNNKGALSARTRHNKRIVVLIMFVYYRICPFLRPLWYRTKLYTLPPRSFLHVC